MSDLLQFAIYVPKDSEVSAAQFTKEIGDAVLAVVASNQSIQEENVAREKVGRPPITLKSDLIPGLVYLQSGGFRYNDSPISYGDYIVENKDRRKGPPFVVAKAEFEERYHTFVPDDVEESLDDGDADHENEDEDEDDDLDEGPPAVTSGVSGNE